MNKPSHSSFPHGSIKLRQIQIMILCIMQPFTFLLTYSFNISYLVVPQINSNIQLHMSQNLITKNQSKKIIVIRTDRSSSAASSNHSKSSSIQKHYPTHSISYNNNHNQSKESTYSINQSRNSQDKQLQKLQSSHVLSNQLSLIQNQILDLRFQITRQIAQKYELQKQLNHILQQQQAFMNTVYKEINHDYFQNIQGKSNYQNSSQKGIQKISGVDFNQLASQIVFLFKSNQINEQALKSKQNYISGLKDQNASLRKKVSRLLNQNKKIPQKRNMDSQTQITDVQEVSISTIKHFSFNEVVNIQKVNAQVQTDQKRIGLAQAIQNIRSYQKLGHNNSRISPYRHYLETPQRQSRITISKQRKYQNVQGIPKKINLQSIKDKRLNQKNLKKKIIASTPYINHLLLQSKQITIQETTTIQGNQQTRLNIRLQNPKSQLSYRRPIHRSRSQSQQQIPSSAQRSRSNYSSSRKLSGYSINPLNKYGQKRLCNQINGKKVRKISRLSQQSEQLEQRMKQLEQEQKKLNQKYNLLAQMKLVKSVPIHRSRSKCNPIN